MPIYEYNCKKCGKKFEKLVKISEGNIKVECPDCGSGDVKKVFSVFGVCGEKKAGGSSCSSCSSPSCSSG